MKKLLSLAAILTTCIAFAKTAENPKLAFEYEVCEARHAGRCETVQSKAAINCDSDYDQVCKKIENKESNHVLGSVECKLLSLSTSQSISGNISDTFGLAGDFISRLILKINNALFCDGEGQCEQLQRYMLAGEDVPFKTIDKDGMEQVSTERIRTTMENIRYSTNNEHNTEVISKIKCD